VPPSFSSSRGRERDVERDDDQEVPVLVAPHRPFRWLTPCCETDRVDSLIAAHGLHPVAAKVLAARGWQSGRDLDSFINPKLSATHDPFLLRDMSAATDRLVRAVREREPILVYGDYDVDGATATSLLVGLFRFLKVPVDFYIPDRLKEGYGIKIDALEAASRRFRLIVTVDTGTTCLKELDWAKRHGIDIVVTDHHTPSATLPQAVALVNPNRCDCTYPDKHLAGVGVAFKLAHALLKAVDCDRDQARKFLGDQLDLVAVGTVCDMVPLVGENRPYVRQGLKLLERPARVGLAALKMVSGFEYDHAMTPREIGFGLGPRLNAAGRTSNARMAVELLLEKDEAAAHAIAEKLDSCNDERRRLERTLLQETGKQMLDQCDVANQKVLVCGGRGWHVGIVGIVASRLLDMYCRPAIVCAIDENGVAKGSGRSIEGFNLHAALSECRDLLIEFGGHMHAAGVRLKADNLCALRERLNECAKNSLKEEDLTPALRIDAKVDLDECTLDAVRALEDLAPYGHDHKTPTLMLSGVSVEGAPRIVGRNHLKLRIRRGTSAPVDVIGFGQAHHLKMLTEGARHIDLCGLPTMNHFRGLNSLQFEMRDLRPAM